MDIAQDDKSLIFRMMTTLHVTWAILLLASPVVATLSPFAVFFALGFSTESVAMLLIIVSVLASLPATDGMFILLQVPQQAVAMICAMSSIQELRHVWSAELMLAVQIPVILIGVFHLFAMLRYGGWSWNTFRSWRLSFRR